MKEELKEACRTLLDECNDVRVEFPESTWDALNKIEELIAKEEQPTKNAEEFLKSNCKLNDWNRLENDLNDSLWTNNVIGYLEQYASIKTPTEEEVKKECYRRFERIPNDEERMGREDAFYQGAKWVIKQLKK